MKTSKFPCSYRPDPKNFVTVATLPVTFMILPSCFSIQMERQLDQLPSLSTVPVTIFSYQTMLSPDLAEITSGLDIPMVSKHVLKIPQITLTVSQAPISMSLRSNTTGTQTTTASMSTSCLPEKSETQTIKHSTEVQKHPTTTFSQSMMTTTPPENLVNKSISCLTRVVTQVVSLFLTQ
jgi:hypothetical protein